MPIETVVRYSELLTKLSTFKSELELKSLPLDTSGLSFYEGFWLAISLIAGILLYLNQEHHLLPQLENHKKYLIIALLSPLVMLLISGKFIDAPKEKELIKIQNEYNSKISKVNTEIKAIEQKHPELKRCGKITIIRDKKNNPTGYTLDDCHTLPNNHKPKRKELIEAENRLNERYKELDKEMVDTFGLPTDEDTSDSTGESTKDNKDNKEKKGGY